MHVLYDRILHEYTEIHEKKQNENKSVYFFIIICFNLSYFTLQDFNFAVAMIVALTRLVVPALVV